jgi:hypothetical protein
VAREVAVGQVEKVTQRDEVDALRLRRGGDVLLSGSFGAVSREPPWLETLMRWLPAQPIVEGAQRALHGAAFPALTARDAAVLAAWTAIGFVVSQRWFRWW